MSVPPAEPPLFGETESIIGLGGLDELASIPRDDRQKTAIRNAKNQRMGNVVLEIVFLVLPSSMLRWSAEREVSRCMCGN